MSDTINIPQADMLWDVARVPEVIARGYDTPHTIGAAIGAKGPRQGLYYTQAARILGLVGDTLPDGRVSLTAYGRAFARYDRTSQRQALRRLLRDHEPMRSVVEALRTRTELSAEDVARLLQYIAPLADSTALRRSRTVIAWLVTAGLASWRDGRLRYNQSLAPGGAQLRKV
jgi:hypothetical protein